MYDNALTIHFFSALPRMAFKNDFIFITMSLSIVFSMKERARSVTLEQEEMVWESSLADTLTVNAISWIEMRDLHIISNANQRFCWQGFVLQGSKTEFLFRFFWRSVLRKLEWCKTFFKKVVAKAIKKYKILVRAGRLWAIKYWGCGRHVRNHWFTGRANQWPSSG